MLTNCDSAVPTPHAISKNDSLLSNSSVTVVQDPPTASTGNVVDYQEMETLDSSSPEMPSQTPKMNSIGSQRFGVQYMSKYSQKQEVHYQREGDS